MKSFTIVALALLLSLVFLTKTTQADLLANGDFATGVLTPWQSDNTGAGVEDTGAPNGYAGTVQRKTINGTPNLYQTIAPTMAAGDVISVSFDLFNWENPGTTINVWGGRLQWYDPVDTGWHSIAPDVEGSTFIHVGNQEQYSWSEHTVTYTAPSGVDYFGMPLRVLFAIDGSSAANTFMSVDNVVANYTAAPEPSAIIMLGAGLLGLLAYAWRKRR